MDRRTSHRRTGSRAVRGGVTRTNRAWIETMRNEPLPDDPAERAVEQLRRTANVRDAMDQRSPANRTAARRAGKAADSALIYHMNRVHGRRLKFVMANGFVNLIDEDAPDETVYAGKVWTQHDALHREGSS